MARHIELLLTENVDNLGIVGDVVKVRPGYARNYLLPFELATTPTPDAVAALAGKRAEAEKQLRELRAQREKMIEKMQELEIELTRSCNDLGMLYGSVTQQDIATALGEKGFNVKPREIRLAQTIKRVDTYHFPVKLDTDLEAEITLKVIADRQITEDAREEMEFDDEGNLVEKPRRESRRQRERAEAKDEDGVAGKPKAAKE